MSQNQSAADLAIQRYSQAQEARINVLRKIRGALHLLSAEQTTAHLESAPSGLTPRFVVIATLLSCLQGLLVYCLLTWLKIG